MPSKYPPEMFDIINKTASQASEEMLISASLFTKAEFEAEFLPCPTMVVIDNRAEPSPYQAFVWYSTILDF